MDKNAFLAAIRLSKLLLLYKPVLMGADRGFKERVARLRSLTEQLVAQAMLGKAPKASETVLKALYDAAKTSLVEQLNVSVLLEQQAVRMPPRKALLRPMGRVWKPIFLLERVEEVVAGVPSMFMDDGVDPLNGERLDNQARGELLSRFGSVVRNMDCLPLLLELGVPANEAVRFNTQLLKLHSSHPGRERLSELLDQFCPGSNGAPKKGGRKPRLPATHNEATGLFKLSIQLDAQALSAHPEFARLTSITLPKSGEPREYQLSELLAHALVPVEVPPAEDITALAERMVGELLGRLTLREQALKAAKAKEAKEQAKEHKAKVMAELKKLDPKLLQALKKDPGLLDQV